MLRVFLSYHTPDRTIALSLKRAIEDALPGADLVVDQTHLRYGHLWQPSLFDAIAKAQAFLILVSHRAGDWQKFEYYEALDRKVKNDAFVLLPIIVADRAKGPVANLPGLAQLHWIESTEPTAPDPLAKIVAALAEPKPAKPPEPWRVINPYRGLVALEEQDADFFFGRDSETREIIDKIIAAPGRLIALVGNSGVGKSSLVQAGVIGSLKRQRWPGRQHVWPETLKDSRAWAYLAMKPAEDPIGALMSEFSALWFPDPTDPRRVDRRQEWAERLREGKARLADVIKASDDHLCNELSLTPPPRVLLYIDQGEELYARSPPAERKRFSEIVADGLARNPERLIVMTSQRADYYGELQANAPLFRLTETIDVPPLDADNLALVLREPARVLGVGFESDDLVGHVFKSVEGQPGALPLLADLFTDLWERMRERGDGTLRVSDRREIIQVSAVLSKRADQFLAKHPDKVEAVRRLFTLRLAHVPRQGEPVRARWECDAKQEVDPAVDAEWALVELLAGPDWRLLVTGEKDGKATAEVAHEILFKTWPTLKHWLEDERDFLVWRGELGARREEYDKAGREGARQQRQAVLLGLPLDTAKKWLSARRGDIEPADQAFIKDSVQAERAAARKWAWLQGAVGVLLLCIIGVLLERMYGYARMTALECDSLAAEIDDNSPVDRQYDRIDPSRAIPACRTALSANPDNPRLMHNLGRSLDKAGQFAEAAVWYGKAADLKYDWAKNNLAVLYLTKKPGVPMDFGKGVALLRAAAEQNHPRARVTYGETDFASLLENRPVAMLVEQALAARGLLKPEDVIGQFGPAAQLGLEEFKNQNNIPDKGVTLRVLDRLGVSEKIKAPDEPARQ